MTIELDLNPAPQTDLVRADHFKLITPILDGVKIITVDNVEFFFTGILLAEFLEHYKTYWNRVQIETLILLKRDKVIFPEKLFLLKQEIILNWFAYYNRQQSELKVTVNDLADPETWRIIKSWAERIYGRKLKKAAVLAASILGIPVHSYQNWLKSEEYFQSG